MAPMLSERGNAWIFDGDIHKTEPLKIKIDIAGTEDVCTKKIYALPL